MEELTNVKRKQLGLGIVAALLLVSLIGNGVFMSRQQQLRNERNEAMLNRDSILSVKLLTDKALDKAKTTLDECQGKNSQMELLVSELNKQVNQQKVQVEKLLKENAGLAGMRKKLKDAQKLRDDCDKLMQECSAENSRLKADNVSLMHSVNSLSQENEDLEKKLEWAKNLKAYDISVTGYKATKSRQRPTIRAKKTNRISVSFTLAENRIAEPGNKNVYVVIYDTKKNILGKSGQKFSAAGLEQAYTALKGIEFKNDEQKQTISFDAENKLVKGKYKIEIYTDGVLSGKKEFELR